MRGEDDGRVQVGEVAGNRDDVVAAGRRGQVVAERETRPPLLVADPLHDPLHDPQATDYRRPHIRRLRPPPRRERRTA